MFAPHLIVGRARDVHDDVAAPAGQRELRELAVRAAPRRRLIDLELRHLLHAPIHISKRMRSAAALLRRGLEQAGLRAVQAAALEAQPANFQCAGVLHNVQCAGVPQMGCPAQGIGACADAAHRPEQLLGVQHARYDRNRKVEGVDGPRWVPRVIELKRRPEVDAILHSQQRFILLTARVPCLCAASAGALKNSALRIQQRVCDAYTPHNLASVTVNKHPVRPTTLSQARFQHKKTRQGPRLISNNLPPASHMCHTLHGTMQLKA